MKRKLFSGVAVHSENVPAEPAWSLRHGAFQMSGELPRFGLWLKRKVSSSEKKKIKSLNPEFGHIGVHIDSSGTTVTCLGRPKDSSAARPLAARLARAVSDITGAQFIFRKLPSYRAVRHALQP